MNPQRNREQHEADHEKSAVMGAASDHFAHLLRDNARHRVDRLENRTEALTEVRNRNPISSAEQDDHRLANHATEAEQNRGDNPGERRWDDDASNRLKPVCPERVRRLLKTARHVAKRVFRQRENRRHGHEREEATGRENI